ncbi:SDR family oxidoreductase [Limibaculum sp. FT325]|uniref:SDR family NAD(P)-dependent oxidoreductase n=1 Tax=Thermohalobaculum sediminis TaxID=2939436 RepID=UPI0020BF16AE|nr:SDR family oxidoreductase [Limibaculum sediminis]MCL5777874.1 SDR family oxidoreductase [Limibaculum sediminis]
MSLAGKVILVTGASSGLGAHMAGFLAGRGARVWAAARRIEALDALARGATGSIHPVAMDVTDPASIAAGIARVVGAEGRLDGLVNNAGIAWGGRAIEMTDDDWARVIDTNLTGAFTVAREAAKAMAGNGGGAIVSTASILGFGTGAGVAAYAASKAAVVHLTRCLALEWARMGIRVNALAPGYVPTEINRDFLESAEGEAIRKTIPMRRFGTPQDLDGPLELLLSDAGGYITGVTLPVDGGHLCRPL